MKKFIDAVKQDESPQIYGGGEQIRCFCHVKDAANGVVRALFSPQTGEEIINIGNDTEQVTMLELAEKVISLSGKDLRPHNISFSQSDRDAEREIFHRIPSIEKAKQYILDKVPDTVIVGVEPQDIDTLSIELTPCIQSKVDPMIQRVLSELDRLNVPYNKRKQKYVSRNPIQDC